MKQHLVVLTGAGISAESGLRTFRDNNGLWEEYSIYDVATPEAWESNPKLVLEFYNQRRQQLFKAEPNEAHAVLKDLEDSFFVSIITQNIDDLHERAGSTNVLHLHGELKKARSTVNPNVIVTLDNWQLNWGDLCPEGSQLRPHVVWFGEDVPMMVEASRIASQADIMLVVGTSLNVYPAASLVHFVNPGIPLYVVDPSPVQISGSAHHIQEKATTGMQKLKHILTEQYGN